MLVLAIVKFRFVTFALFEPNISKMHADSTLRPDQVAATSKRVDTTH